PPGDARHRARTRDRRLLSLLAGNRHAAAFVVEHRGRRRRRRIYRDGERTAHRISVRACDPRADLSRLLSHRPRSRALAGFCQRSAWTFLLSVRPVRDLPRAALPADTNGLARRALLDDGFGLELCLARRAMGTFV